MRFSLLLLFITLFITQSYAETLTIRECYRAALEYNAQRKLQTERMSETSARIDEAAGQRLPSVSVNGSATHNGDVEVVKLGMSSFSMMPDNSYRGVLQLNQVLYDGNRVSNTIAVQKQNLERNELDRNKSEHDVAYAVSAAYWNWTLSCRVEKVASESKISSRNNADLVQKRFEAGQVSRFDVLRANVQAEQFATNWESAIANRTRAAQNLSYWTGIAIDTNRVPADSLTFFNISSNYDSLLAIAKFTRTEFSQFEKQKNIANIGIRLSKVGWYPMLTGSANVMWANGTDPFDPNKLLRSWSIGAQLNYPLFDGWQTRAKVEEAQSVSKQTDWQILDFERSVGNEIRNGLIGLSDAEHRLRLQDSYVSQAEEAYRLAQEQYSSGQLSGRDVTDAELALSNARMSREQAMYDWTMAFVGLHKATGELRNDLLRGTTK